MGVLNAVIRAICLAVLVGVAVRRHRAGASRNTRKGLVTGAAGHTVRESQPVKRWRGIAARLAIVGTAMIVLVTAAMISFKTFVELSAAPAPAADPGEVTLYFDRPGVRAYLETRVTEYGGTTELRHYINIDEYAGDSVGFMLVSTGRARTAEQYPSGEPSSGPNGCWASVIVTDQNNVECYTARLSPGSLYAAPEAREPAQVIAGRIDRDGDTSAFTIDIVTQTNALFAVQEAKRTYFALPKIGTSYVPEHYRDRITFEAGNGRTGYVPTQLDIAVDYRDLEQTDRVENITPEPLTGSLSWVVVDESSIGARGSIVDTLKEEEAQRALFVIAVYAGIFGSVLPMLVIRAVRLTRRLSRIRRAGRQLINN